MKRRRGDQLTGGSNDVNPQWFVMPPVDLGGVVADIEMIQVPIPIQRLSQRSGKALVMELLRFATAHTILFGDVSGGTIQVSLGTAPLSSTVQENWGNPKVIAMNRTFIDITTPAGSAEFEDQPIEHDLQDGAGHGLLVGSDSLFIQVSTSGVSAIAPQLVWNRILYRWKEVSLDEYIGIVQSQQ